MVEDHRCHFRGRVEWIQHVRDRIPNPVLDQVVPDIFLEHMNVTFSSELGVESSSLVMFAFSTSTDGG